MKVVAAQLSDTERQLIEHEDKNNELLGTVSKERNACFDKEREFNEKNKDYELEKEKEVVLLSDK